MKQSIGNAAGPHQGQPVLHGGAPPEQARAAMIMVHGRGADARDIISLAPELGQPDFAYFAPQASGNTWYPFSFLAPIPQNEPGITSGLQAIADILAELENKGFPTERVFLLGFSQGACLATEFAARRARRYGGLIGFSGGLIGPGGTPRDYPGALAGTPVFLGCSDPDPHIPRERVEETAAVLKKMGGEVTLRLYPRMGHTINSDEIEFARGMMRAVL